MHHRVVLVRILDGSGPAAGFRPGTAAVFALDPALDALAPGVATSVDARSPGA